MAINKCCRSTAPKKIPISLRVLCGGKFKINKFNIGLDVTGARGALMLADEGAGVM
ncbi:hypothetical protein DZ939_016395 [Pseudomonas aeruginosa]|nr:hypothetical protein [Pseudomonas aeruginosa]